MTADQLLQFKDTANDLFANLQYVIGGEKLTFQDKESYVVDWIANSVPLLKGYTKYVSNTNLDKSYNKLFKNWRILSFFKPR